MGATLPGSGRETYLGISVRVIIGTVRKGSELTGFLRYDFLLVAGGTVALFPPRVAANVVKEMKVLSHEIWP